MLHQQSVAVFMVVCSTALYMELCVDNVCELGVSFHGCLRDGLFRGFSGEVQLTSTVSVLTIGVGFYTMV